MLVLTAYESQTSVVRRRPGTAKRKSGFKADADADARALQVLGVKREPITRPHGMVCRLGDIDPHLLNII